MKNLFLKGVIIVAVVSFVICLSGLGTAIQQTFFYHPSQTAIKSQPVKKPVKASQNQTMQLLALGDSLTHGMGDTTGKGYIGDLLRRLKSQDKEKINVTNLAINGETSTGLLKQMKQPEVQRQIKKASVIVFTIGGNDLFNGGQNFYHFSLPTINKDEKIYLQNLNLIYQQMRTENKQATIFHVGIYNPFNTMQNAKATSGVVRKWNDDSAEVAANYQNVVEVPTYDLFQLHVNQYLSDDHFHPNATGYKRIADVLLPLIPNKENGGNAK